MGGGNIQPPTKGAQKMINNCTVVGRLTQDPNLQYTPDGTAVATVTLAVNRPFKNKSGENEADFIPVVIWRKPAENTANYMKKGGILGVTGRWQTRNYENAEGKRVYISELVADNVQFIGGKSTGNSGNSAGNSGNNYQPPQPDDIDVSDDDLPF
jgi:single-strand DNA-binding protein